jgi:hypothetical protein
MCPTSLFPHLPGGEAHRQPGRIEQGARRLGPERLPGRHLRHRNGITFRGIAMAKAIDDHEDHGARIRTGHLGWGAGGVISSIERSSECITAPKPE